MKRIAIIGCGNIGSELSKAIDRGIVRAKLVALYDIIIDKCTNIASTLSNEKPTVAGKFEELLTLKPDIVVEAASQEAVRQYGEQILLNGIDLVVLSVGALLNDDIRKRLREASHKTSARIYIPSGAIAGLDAIRALSVIGIDKIILRTRKPPKTLKGAPGAQDIELDKLTKPQVIFRGHASKAVKLFPANINVAATLTLMANREPIVEIIADPTINKNIHEIIVESKASKIRIVVENNPSPSNPKTSYLAVLSVIELLRSITSEHIF